MPENVEGEEESRALTDQYRGRVPDDLEEDGWELSTIARRFRSPGDETVEDAVTGDMFETSTPHYYITLRRDPYPDSPGTTSEFRHYCVQDREALDEWFTSSSS